MRGPMPVYIPINVRDFSTAHAWFSTEGKLILRTLVPA